MLKTRNNTNYEVYYNPHPDYWIFKFFLQNNVNTIQLINSQICFLIVSINQTYYIDYTFVIFEKIDREMAKILGKNEYF